MAEEKRKSSAHEEESSAKVPSDDGNEAPPAPGSTEDEEAPPPPPTTSEGEEAAPQDGEADQIDEGAAQSDGGEDTEAATTGSPVDTSPPGKKSINTSLLVIGARNKVKKINAAYKLAAPGPDREHYGLSLLRAKQDLLKTIDATRHELFPDQYAQKGDDAAVQGQAPASLR